MRVTTAEVITAERKMTPGLKAEEAGKGEEVRLTRRCKKRAAVWLSDASVIVKSDENGAA